MNFLVFGAGATGSFIGGMLSQRHPVTLVARRPHVEAIRSNGLTVRGRTELRVRPRAAVEVSGTETPDVVLVTVKSYDTAEAARALEPLAGRAVFLSLQNGIGNLETLSAGVERLLGGVTYQGVTFVGPGLVEHAGEGDTIVGPVQGTSLNDAESVAAVFRECGLPTTVTADIGGVIWTKAVVNACFNPLTALLRVRSGAIWSNEWLRGCSELIVTEAVAVANAYGVALDGRELLARVRAVSEQTAENRSSMLQDLERGRATEIDAINGAIARMGAERAVDCPVNQLLTLLVKAAGEVGAGTD